MELRLGFMSNKELALWFGMSITTITKKKAIYLAKLVEYCDFKPVYGGIEVKTIYKSFYCKNKNYQIVDDNFDTTWDPSGLDTCSNVAAQIYSAHKEELTVKETTTYAHVRQARNERYGKPMVGTGRKGTCEYVWCKKENGKPVFLTPEEEALKRKLLSQCFAGADEKAVMIQNMIKSGEITKEEAWQYYSDIMDLPNNYEGFLREFLQATGIQLIKGTLIHDELQFDAAT